MPYFTCQDERNLEPFPFSSWCHLVPAATCRGPFLKELSFKMDLLGWVRGQDTTSPSVASVHTEMRRCDSEVSNISFNSKLLD